MQHSIAQTEDAPDVPVPDVEEALRRVRAGK